MPCQEGIQSNFFIKVAFLLWENSWYSFPLWVYDSLDSIWLVGYVCLFFGKKRKILLGLHAFMRFLYNLNLSCRGIFHLKSCMWEWVYVMQPRMTCRQNFRHYIIYKACILKLVYTYFSYMHGHDWIDRQVVSGYKTASFSHARFKMIISRMMVVAAIITIGTYFGAGDI